MDAKLYVNGKIYKINDISGVMFPPTTVLTLHTDQHDFITITGNNKELTTQLALLAEKTKHKSISEFDQKLLTITPEEVVAYFEQSPDLRAMTDDVKEALLGKKAINYHNQLESDLKATRHLINPSKADIAEVLTGNRYYSGQNHKRVTAVFEAISSSSTPEEDFYAEKQRLAA
jgi:hypothetical protein